MKILKISGLLFLLLIAGVGVWCLQNMKDRHPGYSADLKIIATEPGELRAGFAAVPVTPEVPDKWIDANGDKKYRERDGDYFIDGNDNGKFDRIWIAGFSNNKPANGVHDDIWARTVVLDDGKTRLALIVLDAIGFMHDDVVDIRKMIPDEWGITYTIVASTHTHEGPDMMGIWGRHPLKKGTNSEYMQLVKERAVESAGLAVEKLAPAVLEVSEDLTGASKLVKDTRMPEVFDSGLRMIKAVGKESGEVLGALLSWGNHPETLWSSNLMISSDFPHFFREGVENGVYVGDSLVSQGIGGTAIYFNGAVGGLMCTHPTLPVTDPLSGEVFSTPSFGKARAQGNLLSLLALNAMKHPDAAFSEGGISVVAKSLELPVDNKLFRLATALGVLDRGTSGWMKVQTELAVISVGPLTIVTVPGEIYPEIVNGGVEAPEEGDFGIPAVEVPAIRNMMPGRFKFVIGLANDEIGYIIPKSQWDVKPPFAYGRNKAQYGEENSMGPETAPLLHAAIKQMLNDLN